MDLVMLLNYGIAFFTLFVVNVFLLLYLRHKDDCQERPKSSGRQPIVSIVIPAYNEGPYIGDSLKTILAIDYPADKLDIIVVDDGSTDDTYKIAKGFETTGKISGDKTLHSPSLRVFTKKNGGKGAALNFGITRSRGEFVATMDADSYVTPAVINEILPLFREHDVMAVTPSVKVKPSECWIKEFQRVEYLLILFSRKLLSFIDSVPVTPGPFSVFRKSVFAEIGGFDEDNLVEDQEIALRIQAANYRIKSSMTADVYTEPPDNMKDLLKQRIRWQRGGFRNYWKYKYMIKPEYGDFGMYFVPLNFVTITAFFLMIGLMLNSVLSTPYYSKYIWLETFGLNIGLFTFIGAFVFITSTIFLFLSIRAFEEEKIKLRYILAFMIFYWFLAVGYNTLFIYKEIRKEATSW